MNTKTCLFAAILMAVIGGASGQTMSLISDAISNAIAGEPITLIDSIEDSPGQICTAHPCQRGNVSQDIAYTKTKLNKHLL